MCGLFYFRCRMKCFGLWINDDGTAQVAELSPEQGMDLADQVSPQPAESAEKAVQMLRDMAMPAGGAMDEIMAQESAMKGYGTKPRMGM